MREKQERGVKIEHQKTKQREEEGKEELAVARRKEE
jgi:hypothetical protein